MFHNQATLAPKGSPKIFRCHKCGEKFSGSDDWKKHSETHKSPKRGEATTSNTATFQKSQPLGVVVYSCYKCHQTFTCVDTWRSHEEEHWNEVIKMIQLKEKSSVPQTKPDETCFKIPKLTTANQGNPSKAINEVNISDLLVQQILMT